MLHKLNIVFISSTFIFLSFLLQISPAQAHSSDYCVSVLQDAARRVAEGANTTVSLDSVVSKDSPGYAEFVEKCNQELKEAGLFTITEVNEKPEIAELVLQGTTYRDSLNKELMRQQEADLKRREQSMAELRLKICANPTPETAFACPKNKELK